MKAARSWGVPYSVFRGERAPTERWSSRDATLAVALTQLEAQLCSGCGQPQWLTFDPKNAWEAEDDPLTCAACYVRDTTASAWMKSHERSDGDEPAVKAPNALRWTVHQHHPEGNNNSTE